MRLPVLISLAVAACFAVMSARATSSYQYGRNEYVIISDGLAPNKQLSLASHGGGELGDQGFHVWLMAEPAHRKIVALDNISDDTILDTGAGAFRAVWSKDSRHVGVTHRSDRHELALDLYRIEDRRAHLITGPSLFREVTSREVTDGDDLRQRLFDIKWHDGNRFLLREFRSFVAADDSLVKLFGKFGRVGEKMDDGKLFITFAADAECELLPGDRYRVVDLKPGDPDTDHW
jgi:hypothetical protein